MKTEFANDEGSADDSEIPSAHIDELIKHES